MKKINIEYIKSIVEIESRNRKQPKLWINDIYKLQDDKFYKRKEINVDELDKDEFTELIILEWLMFLSKKIFRYTKKSIKNNTLHFSTKNDISKPDIRIGKEWYELTFADLKIFRFSDGAEFENHILNENIEKEIEKIKNNKNILVFEGDGNKKQQQVFSPELVMENKAKRICNAIKKKSSKTYDTNYPVNLVIYTDRNLNHDITMQAIIIIKIFKNHYQQLLLGLNKFKNIYLITEDKVNNKNFDKRKMKRAVLTTLNKESIKWFNENIDSPTFTTDFYKCEYINWINDLNDINKDGYTIKGNKLII
ncbi:MAG: hypothetical protein GY679_03210 [Mycoplasma sp.]|nr:hypothetical protein [Mycoplasma sp.]